MRAVDHRYRHRPALHPGGDRAGAEHFALIFFGALFTTLSSVISVWLLRRTGEDRATAFFASMPGGSGRWSTWRAQWRGAQPGRGRAELAGAGGGAVRAGAVQVVAG
jgi:hypothetical protein